ncbi:hypothetical protein JY651_11815 [Pyxidicoccus parkwayensis]|uniref:Lipoprotein n=1 Tax=Pyxidicoccus parkwayensis TaxID=2813578 RepID=A0ABX7P503_9BACT|nr:hypothetical protein [Pyxidicoccus parkwaysis]QSQ25568.1 hypothetical protein JY651_11815 [Pyxidicoccus parkwaysis]
MKTRHERTWMALLGATALTLASGCGTDAQPPSDPVVDVEEDLNPERRGIGALPDLVPSGPTAMAITVDPRRSLVVTDQTILSGFSFSLLMSELVSSSGVATTELDLFQRWWDTARPSPGLSAGNAHCDTTGIANMNGFPYTCSRKEGDQALVDPFTNPTTNLNAYIPVGLFNRFDLASVRGANCGEYRIAYAKRSGISNGLDRNLLIFEAVLPNPNPSAGLEGCRPVANFWADLTNDADPVSRASKLRTFYFIGLPGFMPVVHIDNYGNRTTGTTGQVRTNQFMQANWLLREFKIRKECRSLSPCTLRFIPTTVKTNPGGTLFNPASVHPEAATFQNSSFPAQVSRLAVNDINTFTMFTTDIHNSGQSDEQSATENHYVNNFGVGASTFRTNIQTQLTALGSALTPDNIVARAQSQSCAGCHQFSNGANLGGGIIWPASLRFTHVSEQTETGPDGLRHRISPALTNVFIPHRKAVFETFLNAACGDGVCNSWESSSFCPADC